MQFSQLIALFALCALLGLASAAPIDSVHGINNIVFDRRQTEAELQEDTKPVKSEDGTTLSLYGAKN